MGPADCLRAADPERLGPLCGSPSAGDGETGQAGGHGALAETGRPLRVDGLYSADAVARLVQSGGACDLPEPSPTTSAGEPWVHGGRPVDPKAAGLRAEKNPLKRLGKALGPGLITGASDDDPSGIGTYAQAGAQHGFATLWMPLVMLPMVTAVQYMCAKIGMVTGRGLAGVLREHYPRALYPAVIALVIANTLNAGADIGAIAAAINLLVPIWPLVLVVPVSLGIVGLQLFGDYRLIEKVFKWLTLALLAYIGAALLSRPNVANVALLGTTISPYLFFWQASEEVEEEIGMGRIHLRQREGASRFELKYAMWDTLAGMVLAVAVAYSIVLATGATLFAAGKTNIVSATVLSMCCGQADPSSREETFVSVISAAPSAIWLPMAHISLMCG